MSGQEVQVEQSQQKFGLKRKLTGPPRLLLGKFRAKTQGDNQTEAQTKGPNGMNDSKGPGMGSPKNRQGNMGEDGSLGICVENFQKLTGKQPEMQGVQVSAMASEVCSTIRNSEAEGEGCDVGNTVKGRAKKKSRRWLWAPSLVCIRRRRRRACGEQTSDRTFHDAKTDLAGKLFVADPTGPSEDPKATTSQCQPAVTEGKGGFPDRAGSTLKRLLTSNKSKEPKGAHWDPAVQSRSSDQLHPKVSFRKKMGLIFKRGSKNAPTSAEHRGTTAPPDEETGGLPLSGKASSPEGDCSEATSKSGGHLTVSVEVSNFGHAGMEKRKPAEGSNRDDGCGSPVGLRKMAEEHKPRRCYKDEQDRPDRRLKSDLPSKAAGSLPPVMEETPAAEKDSDWSPGVGADSLKDLLKESDVSSLLDVACTENDRIPENVRTEDAMGSRLSLSGIAVENSVQDPLVLNGIDCMGYLSRDVVPVDIEIVVTNGPMGSPLEDLHRGDRSLVTDHPCEALLVQTASSLVQAAVKAALDQIAEELEAAAAAHQEAQACKCQL
ncbi:hypothetical protein COCON_G00095440 [Conger conger]|uniref:Uncharacterized protein n=1 Tax=Conger conger TaxID=82655 RepID=A0A9Q1DM71_CONCO|nr:uncharacterized protein si:dkey-1h6.8 [Conger conger]KAJ8274919.1 hypothetical protein COCON_G00095440 [Conger conger]